MGQIVQQGKIVDALKSFNNAIVTSRLYPPDAPQVTNAVERGYQGLKLFLRTSNSLLFSFQDDAPCIGGLPVDQEILDSFPNLIIYRQLRLLGLPKLLIGSEMDRFAFGQLLHVFTASIEKIKNEGGGMVFITSRGLASYFPEDARNDRPAPVNDPVPVDSRSRKLVKVRPELLACLCGQDKRPFVEADLRQNLGNTETAVEILAAGVGHILQDMLKKGTISVSPHFPRMLLRAEAEIGEDDQRSVALGLARLLAESLRDPARCLLLAQSFPEGFGSLVYDGLITFLTNENLKAIFALFREQLAKARLVEESGSPRLEVLDQALSRLMNTGKGKQFISVEKARMAMREGEEARQKRRLEAGISSLLQGHVTALKSEELVQHLPEEISRLLDSGAEQEAALLLKKVVEYYDAGGEPERDRIFAGMVAIGEKLVAGGGLPFVGILLEPLTTAIHTVAVGEVLLERAVVFLHQVMQASWKRGQNKQGDSILTMFHQIRSGQLGNSAVLKGLIGRIQDRGIHRGNLPVLLAEYLAAPLDQDLGYRLLLQGPVAVRFLVEALINTDNSADRIKIIDLLTSNSTYLAAIVQERLPEHMPWYGKRNLLKLLGETGQEDVAESVLPFFKHEDFRVQREAFLCLYRIGGKNRKRLLLTALADSSELIKIQILSALTAVCDQEVAAHLGEMLADNEKISEANRHEILSQLVETLSRCGCQEARKAVELFLRSRGLRSTRKIPEKIWEAAEKAIVHLDNDIQENRRKYAQASQLRKNALKQAAKISKAGKVERVITGLPQEQTVRTLLARGEKAGAREVLLQLIERTARSHNFIQADNLREWLIEIDPTAFSHIIQAAELIEQEKMAAIDKGHLEIWARLYDALTTEEFAAVYYALKHRKYQGEEIIVSQGALQTSLFFINSGKVKLFFQDKGAEVLVKTMGSGEIFGAGAFFDASVWTISVASVGTSQVSALKLEKLQAWHEEFPGLESKLHDFCKNFEKIEEFIQRSSRDRRVLERHKIVGRVNMVLVDGRGQNSGIGAIGELNDICEGGLSYVVRISKRENARLLLGRKVRLKLPAGEKPGESVTVTGEILAVRSVYAVENEYSIHVKFDELLKKRQMQEIIRAAPREAQAQ